MRNEAEVITVEDKDKGDRLKSFCIRCGKEQNQVVMKSYGIKGSELYDELFSIDWSDDYQILQCQGCDYISFRHLSWDSESQSSDDDGKSEFLYPQVLSKSKDALPIKVFSNLPKKLKQIYRESIDCFNSKNYTLCAAGVRAIVEGICDNEGIKDGPVEVQKNGVKETKRFDNIQGKISGLCEKGILTKKHSDMLHEHRFLGNEAIHTLARPSEEELRLAIEILEHTFENMYEIPKKAYQLKELKKERHGA